MWDKRWDVKPTLPNDKEWGSIRNETLAATLLIIRLMLSRCESLNQFGDDWATRMDSLIANPPAVANPKGTMGLTSQWQSHSIWSGNLGK